MQVGQLCDEVVEQRSSLRIVEIDPQRDARWEALMNHLPSSVIYQHPAWLQVVEEGYGYKPLHLACEDASGNVHGILPLFYRRGLRSGKICLSPPPVAGPLADSEQASTMLIQAAIERGRSEQATGLQFMTRSTNFDDCVDGVVGVPVNESYGLTLPEHSGLLRLDSRVKRAVNKATRSGLHIRPAETISDLKAWYQLYLETMRRAMVMPHPYRIFELSWRHLQPLGAMRLLLAEHGEAGQRRLVAGFLFFQWNGISWHLYTGWRREDQDLRPNDLLHWQALQDACAQGLRWYDFGHAPAGNQGIAQFKSKWATETVTTYRYSYPLTSAGAASSATPVPVQRTQSAEAAPGRASQVKRAVRDRLVTPLWQRMPLKATQLIAEWSRAVHYY
jgi:CelD/BcsL family acetyltransferase involved in cellulose biosynthesis